MGENMPQISKKKTYKGLMIAGGAVAGTVVAGVQAASADTITSSNTTEATANQSSASSTNVASQSSSSSSTVVSATTSGAGTTSITNDSDTPSQSVVNTINSEIRNLQTSSNGMVTISDTPKIITQSDVTQAESDISQLNTLIQQYNSLKAQLNTQNSNNAAINGMVGANNTETVTGDTLSDSVTNLQDLISQMNAMVASNAKLIADNAANAQQDTELAKTVAQDNTTIANSASDLDNYKNGIIGDLDDINRKSEDSEAANGIVVDNSETQQTNTVTTTASVKSEKTQVSSTDSANENLERILSDIQAQNADNVQQALDASTYRANALTNIDDINAWLKTEQSVAEKAKAEATAATTSITTMSDYKTTMLDKLNDAMTILKEKNAPQKMIDQVQTAIDEVNASGITTEALPAVGQKDPIEFGDIGQSQDTSNGSQDDTIANTKTTEAQKLSDAIASGVAQVQASNTAALNQITPVISTNTKAIDDYLSKIASGGTGSQVDDSFLNNLNIYNTNNNSAIKDFYQNYVKQALAQTSEDVATTQAEVSGSGNISHVTGSPTIAQVSAAMYADNAGTMSDGFGSVMLSDTNINNIVSSINVDTGATVYANSQKDGGAQAVYDALLKMPGYAHTDYSKLAALQDMYNQYLHPNGSTDSKYADNTLTIVTNSPDLSIKLPNSFVYSDADGNTATATTQVTISATAYDGSDLSTDLQKKSATASGSYALYIYNLQIDPYTGQLVAGVSYIAMQNPYAGSGNGVPNTGGGGEGIALSTASTKTVTRDATGIAGEAMDLSFDAIGSPIDQTAADGLGLAQSIGVKVDPTNAQAIKYAKYAPLYVSDIDDGQQLIAYTNSGSAKIVTAANEGEQNGTSDWSNPYGQDGTAISITAYNTSNTTATTNTTTNIDSQSAAIYNINSEDTQAGLQDTRITMRSKGTASDKYNYMAIDTSIFAPFGIVGEPNLDIDQINALVKTLEVNIPTAKAETKGSYHLSSELEYMYTGTYSPETPENISADLTLAAYIAAQNADKQASSNTSMIVTKQSSTSKLTASGNSMTIKTPTSTKTASGNSLVITTNTNTDKTSSGNSLVIRSSTTKIDTASGNSLVVTTHEPVAVLNTATASPTLETLTSAAKNNDTTSSQLLNSAPDVVKNADGTYTVTLSVYVDSTLLSTAQEALSDWKDALAKQGVNLNVNFTSNVSDLQNGVTIAILDSDNGDEIVSSYQDPNSTDYTMSGLGGLTTKVSNDILTPDGENDVYNKSGTVTAGDVLKNSLFTIQLNTEGLSSESFKDALLGGKLDVSVLKHELGHVFGLSHSDSDSLMTPGVSNSDFTGVISNTDAQTAAADLINNATTPADLSES